MKKILVICIIFLVNLNLKAQRLQASLIFGVGKPIAGQNDFTTRAYSQKDGMTVMGNLQVSYTFPNRIGLATGIQAYAYHYLIEKTVTTTGSMVISNSILNYTQSVIPLYVTYKTGGTTSYEFFAGPTFTQTYLSSFSQSGSSGFNPNDTNGMGNAGGVSSRDSSQFNWRASVAPGLSLGVFAYPFKKLQRLGIGLSYNYTFGYASPVIGFSRVTTSQGTASDSYTFRARPESLMAHIRFDLIKKKEPKNL